MQALSLPDIDPVKYQDFLDYLWNMALLPTDSDILFEVKASNMSISMMGQVAKSGKVEKIVHGGVVHQIVNKKIIVTLVGADFGNKQYLDFLENQDNPSLPNVVLYTYFGDKTSPTLAVISSSLGTTALAYKYEQAQLKYLAYHMVLALRDIHQAGFVHGSVSPETIHVTEGDNGDKIVLTEYNCIRIGQWCRRDIYILLLRTRTAGTRSKSRVGSALAGLTLLSYWLVRLFLGWVSTPIRDENDRC